MARFRNRSEAGERLAGQLIALREERPVVLALPRGGVPVAAAIARALDAPLDVMIVRKLGVPFQPELAMGAIGEGGARVLNDDVITVTKVEAARDRRSGSPGADRSRSAGAPLPGRHAHGRPRGPDRDHRRRRHRDGEHRTRGAADRACARRASGRARGTRRAGRDGRGDGAPRPTRSWCSRRRARSLRSGRGTRTSRRRPTKRSVVSSRRAARAVGSAGVPARPRSRGVGGAVAPSRAPRDPDRATRGSSSSPTAVGAAGTARATCRSRAISAPPDSARCSSICSCPRRPSTVRTCSTSSCSRCGCLPRRGGSGRGPRPPTLPIGYFGASTGAAAALWAAAEDPLVSASCRAADDRILPARGSVQSWPRRC